jgi:outer membrane protein OmpA-like peptidoglycan-associated protein
MFGNADASAVRSNQKAVVAPGGSCTDPFEEASMAAHRFSSALLLGIALTCSIHLPAPCLAQESEPNVDAAGCPNLLTFPKLAGSVVVACRSGDSVGVTMQLKPDARGFAREKSVRGIYEYREYQITRADQKEQVFENLMQWAPMAGFIVKYSISPSTITARNGDTWILINVSGDFYNVSVVRVKEEPWTPIKDAEGFSREMQTHSRVAIYGIEFSSNNQAINEENSKILIEVLRYLKENPNQPVIVESHVFGTKGNAEADLEITRKRANAVVDWLVTRGITAGRLQSKALGRTKPVTENDTAIEIQRNERIVLAKAAS